jgi:hypothetical protein
VSASPPATAPLPAPAPGVDIHFDANEQEVALLVRREGAPGTAARYKYICTAPCDARLLPSESRLALSLLSAHPVEVKDPVVVSAATTLRGTYRSYATLRTVGITTLIVGVIVGAVVASVGGRDVEQNAGVGWGLVAGGSAAGIGAAIAGSVMLLKKDQVTIEILPYAVSRIRALPGLANERAADLPTGHRLELRLRF